jgi:LmeA-like phospholipid-binding
VTDPWARPANQAPPVPPPPQFPQGAHPGQGGVPPQGAPGGEPPSKDSSLLVKTKNLFRDPLSIVLVVVIVIALVAAGLLAAELYARHRADTVVAGAAQCVLKDSATVSFDALPPFLMQHMSGHYTNIHIETAGNQVRDAKGMKVNVVIKDVRLEDTADSGGSIGSLVANVTWSSEGIKQTIQDAVPLVGSFVTGVTTNPSAGTIELQGPLGSIVAKPQVSNGGLGLQVTELTGLGFTLPRESVQPALDAFSKELTDSYPLGIHADSVQVTDSGVVSQFSTQNAKMPKDQQDPCFADL